MNVIKDTTLLNTSHIQSLIKDSVSGMVARPGSIVSIDRHYLVEKLESYLNNKIMCEKMRIEPQSIIKEDFIK
jgi:hypothetical protein